MSVCVLWKLLSMWSILSSLAVANEDYEYENYESLQNFSQLCTNPHLHDLGISLYLRNEDGVMDYNASEYIDSSIQRVEEEIPALKDVLRVPLPLNVSCMVDMRNNLACRWDTQHVLEHAEYSISYLLCSEMEDTLLENTEERVHAPHYYTVIDNQTSVVILQLNMSTPNLWYIQTQKWDIRTIEKLDPPILNARRQLAELHLEWKLPKSHTGTTSKTCFIYELRINDEVSIIKERLSHTVQNVDGALGYRVQIRAKMSHYCGETQYWSEWTPIIDLYPTVAVLADFHIGVLIAIALGIPMILLAILLACKFQKVFDKIFPPIPGPSIKIKSLLDKDVTSQILSHKCVEEVMEVEVREDEKEEEAYEEVDPEEEQL